MTNYVRQERAAGRSVVSLLLRATTATSAAAFFNSREGTGERPQLVIAGAGTGSQSATTNAAGTYEFFAPAEASYTLAAARNGYRFTPPQFAITALAADGTYDFVGESSTTTVITSAADAYVNDGASAAANYGTAATLLARQSPSAGFNRQTYLKFDLGATSDVAQVRLRINGSLNSATGGTTPTDVFAVPDTAWGELSVTWNARPAANGAALGSFTVANTTSAWYEVDVTSYVQAERAAGRSVISVLVKNPTATSTTSIFNSREATSHQPQLVITP